MNHDKCVCCGGYVPEGMMVCKECQSKQLDRDSTGFRHDAVDEKLNPDITTKEHPKDFKSSFFAKMRGRFES